MIRIDVTKRPRLPAEIGRENWGDPMTDVHLWQPVIEAISLAVSLQMGTELEAGYPGSSIVFVVGEQAQRLRNCVTETQKTASAKCD